MKTDEQKINCVMSHLSDIVQEYLHKDLTIVDIYANISSILLDSGMDSDLVIKVFENERFGEEGQNQAMNIKVEYGY